MQNAELDFIFHITDTVGVISLSLIPSEEFSNRNRADPIFQWVTALSPPTAFSLCHVLKSYMKPGMVICDPMCGIGTIPIEGARAFPNCVFIGGEISSKCLTQAMANFASCKENFRQHYQIDFVKWDAGRFPLKDDSVDAIICDLPFGMRHGNYKRNRKFYPILLKEVTRVLKAKGIALLLTIEKKLMRKTLEESHFLYEHGSTAVLIGGFHTILFDIRHSQQ